MARPVLHGYTFSVYAWIARLVLVEKGVGFEWREVDPFDCPDDAPLLQLNPFCRVPVLEHDGSVLYETAAIAQYIDERFDGPRLMPCDAIERARMRQIICLVDSDAYWPLVRQVFVQSFRQPRTGSLPDQSALDQGRAAAEHVLGVFETLAVGKIWLVGQRPGLADFHLAPMMSYFAEVDAGRAMLARHPQLSAWWSSITKTASFLATQPDLAGRSK
ncbi:MAG: glutathione S-transferase family protein [Pseudomonadota bacterium]